MSEILNNLERLKESLSAIFNIDSEIIKLEQTPLFTDINQNNYGCKIYFTQEVCLFSVADKEKSLSADNTKFLHLKGYYDFLCLINQYGPIVFKNLSLPAEIVEKINLGSSNENPYGEVEVSTNHVCDQYLNSNPECIREFQRADGSILKLASTALISKPFHRDKWLGSNNFEAPTLLYSEHGHTRADSPTFITTSRKRSLNNIQGDPTLVHNLIQEIETENPNGVGRIHWDCFLPQIALIPNHNALIRHASASGHEGLKVMAVYPR